MLGRSMDTVVGHTAWCQFLALPFGGCLNLVKCRNLSVLQFPHLQKDTSIFYGWSKGLLRTLSGAW